MVDTLHILRSAEGEDGGSHEKRSISVRLDQLLIDRIDAVVRLATARNHSLNRSEVVRDAVDAYLTAIEEEFREELDR